MVAQTAAVLVLADVDPAERTAIERACAPAGFVPVFETSAEAAISRLTGKRFEALIAHLGTPGAALACMRARGKLLRVRIPVLALVDAEDDAMFARAYRAGADEVLVLGRTDWLEARLRALPKPTLPQPANLRGDAVVADADRTRAEVVERVMRDAGFRVEVAVDGFSTRLQAGRPSLKMAIVDASLDDVPAMIIQARAKGARCGWVVRARPEQLDDVRKRLGSAERVAVVSAYGPPDDVLFETNRLLETKASEARSDPRLLHGTILRLKWPGGLEDVGYSYNVSAMGLYVRTLIAPAAETVRVEATAPGSEEKVELEGRVVWRREFGPTRKEAVPAGFGVQITGGAIEKWAEACPKVSTLRPAMLASELEVAAKKSAVRVAKAPVVPATASLVAPTDVDIQPRARQSSVEEMLASVLSETIPDEEAAGAAPLSIDGDGVVELSSVAPVPTPPASEEVTVTAVLPPVEERPTAFPTAPAVEALQRETTRAPAEHTLPAIDEPFQQTQKPPPPDESKSITPESIGFDLTDAAESLPPSAVAPPVAAASAPAETASAAESPQKESAPSTEVTKTAESPRPTSAFAATMLAESVSLPRSEPKESSAPFIEPIAPEPRGAPRSVESDPPPSPDVLPVRKTPIWALALAAIALGGLAAVIIPSGDKKSSATNVTTGVVSAAPAASAPPTANAPVPVAASAEAESASAAPTESAVPTAASGGAPSTVPAASPTAATKVPDAVASDDAAAIAALKKDQALLYVASPLDTNVYVYGLLAGRTNERITTKCGPRFVRLASTFGAWQGEGVVQIAKCGALTRMDMAGK